MPFTGYSDYGIVLQLQGLFAAGRVFLAGMAALHASLAALCIAGSVCTEQVRLEIWVHVLVMTSIVNLVPVGSRNEGIHCTWDQGRNLPMAAIPAPTSLQGQHKHARPEPLDEALPLASGKM